MMQDLGKLIGFTALMQIPFRDDPDALAYLEEIRLALKELEALKAEPQKVEPTNLEAEPTIDAVPVVRCKDCVFWLRDEGYYSQDGECRCGRIDGWWLPEEYCSCGERREEDGKDD